MIHVFHGFLGSPDDFAFLRNDGVVLHDLYQMTSYPEVSKDDVLIGYSMGGRIALEIAQKVNYDLKKVVLINAHPGLNNDEARMDRKEFEVKVANELKTKTREEFLAWWNLLPIFTFDAPIESTEERFKASADLFWKYRLSEQKDHLPEMVRHKEKILFIAGLFDEKYMELVSEMLIPYEITVKGVPGGHRLFQNKEELKQILKSEGIL